VEVEHQIGGIKRCKIVVDKFRNRVAHYIDDLMETACGLHLWLHQKSTNSWGMTSLALGKQAIAIILLELQGLFTS
jgi:hypothetical protein